MNGMLSACNYKPKECYNRPFSSCIFLSKRDSIKMNCTLNHLHAHGVQFFMYYGILLF